MTTTAESGTEPKTKTYSQELRAWQTQREKLLSAVIAPQPGDRAVELLVRNVWRGGSWEYVRHGRWVDLDDGTVAVDVAAWRLDAAHVQRLKDAQWHERAKPQVSPGCSGSFTPLDWTPLGQVLDEGREITDCLACGHVVFAARHDDPDSGMYVAEHDIAGRPLDNQ